MSPIYVHKVVTFVGRSTLCSTKLLLDQTLNVLLHFNTFLRTSWCFREKICSFEQGLEILLVLFNAVLLRCSYMVSLSVIVSYDCFNSPIIMSQMLCTIENLIKCKIKSRVWLIFANILQNHFAQMHVTHGKAAYSWKQQQNSN